MNSTNKRSLAATGIPQPFDRQARHAIQSKLDIAQPKAGVSAQRVNRPIAPPAYKPEPQKRVAQTKTAVAPAKTGVSAQSVKQPIAPPAYHPQSTPRAVQPQMAHGRVNRKLAVAPPVYRPQPVPKVLQTKTALTQSPHAGQTPRRPVAPPVYRPEAKKLVQPKVISQLRQSPTAPPVSPLERNRNMDKPKVGSSQPKYPLLKAPISRALSVMQRKEVVTGPQPPLDSRQGTMPHARALLSHSLTKAKNVVIQRAAPSGGSNYIPTRVEEMSNEEYEAYVESSKKWMAKRADLEVANLKVGAYLYHGTSEDVARIVAGVGLQPASPTFREVPKKGHRWDASRDGFLSMTTKLSGVTVLPKSVILRTKIEQGDVDTWQWKSVGAVGEMVSTLAIPPNKLEWTKNKVDWHPMNEL